MTSMLSQGHVSTVTLYYTVLLRSSARVEMRAHSTEGKPVVDERRRTSTPVAALKVKALPELLACSDILSLDERIVYKLV